ncbi:hypothetical protein EUX98_g682 [Antrodiella citrinella]|uniref:Glycerol-3-phosphate dehydrogenase [NAD(+)] n=1 Tax=Antrodiella citrinella TaxID=2447956 RepID=A0A4S4N6E0_9APHY|nr:hypothetical protein EUX98_g682 [Antrodiella citrinella]
MLSQQSNNHSDKSKVLVFGAGNFGSCLADHLADSQHEVVVWSRSPEVVKSLNETHRNTEYLTDHVFPETLKAIGPGFPSPEVVRVIRRQPTSVSIASLDKNAAQKASDLFHQPWFRCYTGDDPIGVELAGALKNVYAIAAGIADGLGYEHNTRAMLITRGLAEMTRIGTSYGASPLTFLSLAGVGDLFLTCSSTASRNFTVGYRLGKGEKLSHILDTLGSVAEGVSTAKGLKKVIDELGVSAPIATAIYEVLHEDKNVRDRASALLCLPAMSELDLPSAPGLPARLLMQKLGMEE